MTPAEFCQWLEGYLTDREHPDAEVIMAKARRIVAEVKFVPAQPAPFPSIWPQPYQPAAPNPWRPYTAPSTGAPFGPPWITTCSNSATRAVQ